MFLSALNCLLLSLSVSHQSTGRAGSGVQRVSGWRLVLSGAMGSRYWLNPWTPGTLHIPPGLTLRKMPRKCNNIP